MQSKAITQPRRITSLFGIFLPPRKKEQATRHLTITFILLGTIPSKKNLIWAASNFHFLKERLYTFKTVKSCVDFLSSKAGLKVFTQNSKRYEDWIKEETPKIQEQALYWSEKFKSQGLKYPLNRVSVKIYHYWKDEIVRDLSNKLDSVNDLLVAANIVVEDDWKHIRMVHSEGDLYKGKVLEAITRIDVTQSFFD